MKEIGTGKTEQRLIDANEVKKRIWYGNSDPSYMRQYASGFIDNAPTVEAVEVTDKELLRAIKLLIKQYEHSKNSEYVHSSVAHALFHTWKQVEERRTDHV